VAHVLNNVHEYANITINMSVLRHVDREPSINSYEQFYIQLYYYNNKLVPEQSMGENNPLYRLI
jgi:hypothetical protein